MSRISLFEGDSSLPIKVRPAIANPAVAITPDWVLKTRLVGEDGTEFVPTRVESTITDDGLNWAISLSPDDTAAVVVMKNYTRCLWVVEVSNNNLIPPYKREKHVAVNVKKQGLI
jgi:hypothetical protein